MLISNQSRLLLLVIGCVLLWLCESILPLYQYRKNRLRRAMPNIGLTVLLAVTNLALSFATVSAAEFGAQRQIGLTFLLAFPTWLRVVIGIVSLDLAAYFAHVLLHKSSLGWRFHRVHHSDNEVNVTTAFRQHPGETVWRLLWRVLAIAIIGIPLWVVLLYLTLSTLNAQLEHTNIRLDEKLDRWLRLLVVTPNMHKVHHSREQIETDSNYSNIFPIWDRLFGTYTPSVDFNRLHYGLEGFDGRRTQTLTGLLGLPFRRV